MNTKRKLIGWSAAATWLVAMVCGMIFLPGLNACGNLDTLEPAAKRSDAITLGYDCNCALDGQQIVTDTGVGYCMDGHAVTAAAYAKYYCSQTFVYTTCTPDPRTFANCSDGGVAGSGGTGGTGGTAGSGGTGQQLCVPGKQDVCACGGGVEGYQICKTDGSGYDACQCPDGGTAGTGGTAGAAGAAGSGGTGGTQCACVPGKQDVCACGGGIEGYQVCKADCSGYDICNCPDGGTAGTGGTAGAAGAAGSGGTAGTGGADAGDAGVTCTPGQQLECACEAGTGYHICNATGDGFGDCLNCGGGTGGSGGTAGSGGTGGTGGEDAGTDASTPCVPNSEIDCACGNNVTGVQVCKADGSGYDACQCGTNCYAGDLCELHGFDNCEACVDNTVPGQTRDMRCQKGIMVVDLPWDPACYPDAGDGGLANDCQILGTDGQLSVIIKTGSAPPTGQVVSLYGRVMYYLDGGATDYAVWKNGGAGETQVIALPAPATAGTELQFGWDFANAGNTSPFGGTQRCTPTGCDPTDSAQFCVGKVYKGGVSANHSDGSCHTRTVDGNPNLGIVDCTN